MTIVRLPRRAVPRVWGMQPLPAPFDALDGGGEPVGEIWHEGPRGAPLLVKHLFTSDVLSIQVHPGDATAREAGFASGKDEAWLIVAAEPGAQIGLGLKATLTTQELEAALAGGTLPELLTWFEPRPGDTFFVPAGTIHSIGAGITLVEVQQNVDATYRLYDYGRPRALHIDQAMAVAQLRPWVSRGAPVVIDRGRALITAGGAFVLEQWTITGTRRIRPRGEILLIPLTGGASAGGTELHYGYVYAARDAGDITAEAPANLLVAYASRVVDLTLLVPEDTDAIAPGEADDDWDPRQERRAVQKARRAVR